mgnify:CR=1 FL=1
MVSVYHTCGGVMGTGTVMTARTNTPTVQRRSVSPATSSVTRQGAATPSPGSVTAMQIVALTALMKVLMCVVSHCGESLDVCGKSFW